MSRRLMLIVAGALLGVVLVVGFVQGGSRGEASDDGVPTAAQLRETLAGAPAPLAKLHARPNALLAADTAKAELAALKGHPVVVNKWASWCGPCRAEFPTFQRVSAKLGKRVAFLGLNANDGPVPAKEFLTDYVLSYPSISDPKSTVADDLGIAQYFPMTAFFDKNGTQTFVHSGPYYDDAELEADIARYAGS